MLATINSSVLLYACECVQHCTDDRDDDDDPGSTVFDVLPTTCRDDLNIQAKTSVYDFCEDDVAHSTDFLPDSTDNIDDNGDVLLHALERDNGDDDPGSTVFDVLPMTCRDDLNTQAKTCCVYRDSSYSDDDDSVADPDFEPDSTDTTNSDDEMDSTDTTIGNDEICDLQKMNNAVTGDNLADKTAHDTVTSNLQSLSLFSKREREPGCKQSYDKFHYCKFCGNKICSKISRHLLTVHSDETAVKEILFLPKRSKERRMRLQRITNEGNFNHNIDVIQKGEGEIVV